MDAFTTLEGIATSCVGDGKTPNLYIVTDRGKVQTVTTDGPTALRHWRKLAARRPLTECALEDRIVGCLASVEPADDDDPTLVLIDDSHMDRSLRAVV